MKPLLILATLIMSLANSFYFLDFGRDTETHEGWYTILDGVMGGQSSGKVSFNEEALIFSGALSLENNGGFSSLRTENFEHNLQEFNEIEIRVKGDGRSYYLMLEPSTGWRSPHYRQSFPTEAGWTTHTFSLDSFVAHFRGRNLGKSLTPRDLSNIQRLGFMLADKNPGEFRLEVDWVKFR